jgi:hypothetical protein
LKVCIAGPRTVLDMKLVFDCIANSNVQITTVISGAAIGVDSLGEEWAKRNNVPIEQFKPDYTKYGRYYAPLQRNYEMAKFCDSAIVIWNGTSTGTKYMLDKLFEHQKPHILWNDKGVWQYSYRMETTDDDRD